MPERHRHHGEDPRRSCWTAPQTFSFKAIAAASSLSERSVALIVRQYAAAAWRREKATATAERSGRRKRVDYEGKTSYPWGHDHQRQHTSAASLHQRSSASLPYSSSWPATNHRRISRATAVRAVPDVVCGIDIRPAAIFTTTTTRVGTLATRRGGAVLADQLFREPADRGSAATGLGVLLAMRLWGHFAYDIQRGAPTDANLRFWLRLLLGRYLSW